MMKGKNTQATNNHTTSNAQSEKEEFAIFVIEETRSLFIREAVLNCHHGVPKERFYPGPRADSDFMVPETHSIV